MILICILVGIAIGLTSSFLAVGGGIIIVPALVTFLDVPRHQAIATSLAVICMLSAWNTIRFYSKRLVDVRFGLTLGLAGALTAFVVGSFGLSIEEDTLAIIYIIVLTVIARQAFRGGQTRIAKFLSRRPNFKSTGGAMIGAFSGIIAASTGLSGGVAITPYVSASNWISQSRVVPTVSLAMFLNSVGGAGGYVLASSGRSFILFEVAFMIFAAALVSSTLGQKYQHRLSARTRGWLLGMILLALITQTITQILNK